MLKRLLRSIGSWWRRRRGARVELYRLSYVDGDELPAVLLEMMLLPEVTPRWRLRTDEEGPSLHPSVWAADGCRSHFWLRNGLVQWCED
jgi:hypothetical protein